MASYYDEFCFPVSLIKGKIRKSFYPYSEIEQKTVTRKEGKTRLNLTLKNVKTNERKYISLLLCVKKNKDENGKQLSPPQYYIHTKSFENAIDSHKRLKDMQDDLNREIELSLDVGDINPENVDFE